MLWACVLAAPDSVIRSHMSIGRWEEGSGRRHAAMLLDVLRSGFAVAFLGKREEQEQPALGAGPLPLQILEAQRIRMPNSRQSQITRAGQIEFNNKHEARYKTGPQSSSRNVFIRLGREKGIAR